ncbi:tight adherence pilus pseudopilin TadF [Shewanella sairae]|nr:tight adherence pilus pseudopilin TadF [Shewanella sairae]
MKGVFMIELAIGLVVLSGMLVLMLNHLLAFNKKGPLDRAAYSAVTIISERKQLFNHQLKLCSESNCDHVINQAFDLIASSLQRMDSSFDLNRLGMHMEYISIENGNKLVTQKLQKNNCTPNDSIANLDLNTVSKLLPKTSGEDTSIVNSVHLPLYQVTLCYKIPLDILGVATGDIFEIESTAYSFARI